MNNDTWSGQSFSEAYPGGGMPPGWRTIDGEMRIGKAIQVANKRAREGRTVALVYVIAPSHEARMRAAKVAEKIPA